jgi:preprotein translocase subunit SecE
MTSSRKGGEDDEPEITPVPPPERISSSSVSAGTPSSAPRSARFGEDPEERGLRRERGVAGGGVGFFDRIGQFFHDVRAEMKRVSWPTTTEVKNTTIITIIAVIFFAIYLFVVDRGLTFLITQLEKLVGWLIGAV